MEKAGGEETALWCEYTAVVRDQLPMVTCETAGGFWVGCCAGICAGTECDAQRWWKAEVLVCFAGWDGLWARGRTGSECKVTWRSYFQLDGWHVQTGVWTAAQLSSVEVAALNISSATRLGDFLKRRLWVLEWIRIGGRRLNKLGLPNLKKEHDKSWKVAKKQKEIICTLCLLGQGVMGCNLSERRGFDASKILLPVIIAKRGNSLLGSLPNVHPWGLDRLQSKTTWVLFILPLGDELNVRLKCLSTSISWI